MRASIVIAQYGRPQLTLTCLELIRRHHGDEPPVIVVDDGSSASDVEQIAAAPIGNVQLVRQSHQGVTAAWNAGAARCDGDVLIFLNNDVITTGRWVQELVGLLTDERVAVAGVQRRTERKIDNRLLERLPTHMFAAGWCFAVRRGDFESVGGFRGALRLYFSDTDVQTRLLLRCGSGPEGIAIRKLPLRHLGHATTSGCCTRREQWQADRRRFHRLWRGVLNVGSQDGWEAGPCSG